MKVLSNSEKNIVLNAATEVSGLKLYGCRKLHLKSTFQKNSKLEKKKSLLWIFCSTLLFIFHANDIFFTFCLFCFLNLRRVFYRDAIYKESYAHAPVPSSMTAYVLTLHHHNAAQEDNTILILLLVILVISKARNPVLGNAPYWWPPLPTFSVRGQGNIFIWLS